ncbi:MAG TPA: nucleotide exchange factor GrpE [Candidatus Thalassarchaeaceae archaeon]|nr:MAG TPA: nucleotide exchange factor GrpE [Candidatus Poseidoniales archaeon]HII49020.1 nucleotide exchange factor GrpE [Candidatus Thalassarchaeaceae archaeon]|tara:strand:- start:5824 stop:6348 length:525 start_codon:yes stop_codon:yes gene_type:complete
MAEDETSDQDEAQPADELEVPLTPEERIKELEAALHEVEKEMLYKQAEVQNALAQVTKVRSEGTRYGGMGLARRIVGSVENLERAIDHIDDDDENPISSALRMVHKDLLASLKVEGVEPIEALGLPFDPAKMEAITTVPSTEEYGPGMVVSVLESGWVLRDRVLKVARVVVASE